MTSEKVLRFINRVLTALIIVIFILFLLALMGKI